MDLAGLYREKNPLRETVLWYDDHVWSCIIERDQARSFGYNWLYLDSISTKSEAAIAIYKQFGFEEISRYNDNESADVFMRMKLWSASRSAVLSRSEHPESVAQIKEDNSQRQRQEW